MTAVMRAMPQATGPKVLRIGLVASGRILEERIVKQRTSVTVGPSEKSMFVVQANVPPQFKLFELIGNDYYLNFLDGMTGRVALATGITDLVALKGQAKRVGPAYQIRLTEEARGKVVIGETTFLFQFVAPPPVQPRPQLPLSVKGGVASQIDWNLTIIAAFSFLLHFGLIGAMYSDWMDPVVNDDLTAGLVAHGAEAPTPPPVETAEATSRARRRRSTRGPDGSAEARRRKSQSSAASAPGRDGRGRPPEAGGAGAHRDPRVARRRAEHHGRDEGRQRRAGRPQQPRDARGRHQQHHRWPEPAGGRGRADQARARALAACSGLTGGRHGPAVDNARTGAQGRPEGRRAGGGASASVPVSNAEAVIRSRLHPVRQALLPDGA